MRWWPCSGSRRCTRTTRCGRCGRRSRCATRCGRWARSRRGSASTPATCWPATRRPGESLVVGDAVNVAARLEQAAAPGEVLVGEATWALVGHAVRGERLAPISAKGKREPLVAWRLEVGRSCGTAGTGGGSICRWSGARPSSSLLRWALERTEQARPAAPGDRPRPAGHRQVAAGRRDPAPARWPDRAQRAVPGDRRGVVAGAAGRGPPGRNRQRIPYAVTGEPATPARCRP